MRELNIQVIHYENDTAQCPGCTHQFKVETKVKELITRVKCPKCDEAFTHFKLIN